MTTMRYKPSIDSSYDAFLSHSVDAYYHEVHGKLYECMECGRIAELGSDEEICKCGATDWEPYQPTDGDEDIEEYTARTAPYFCDY